MRVLDKTVNVRLLAILLLIGILSALGIHWLHGFQARRQAGFFLDQAELAIEEDRVAEALEHFNRYIRLRPDDLDALEKLGVLEAKLVLEAGQRELFSRAYNRLEGVLRRSPDRTDIRRKLIGLAIASGQFSDARQHISPKYFPQSYQGGELQDAELLVMLATCQMAQGENEQENAQARDSLEKSIGLEPDRLDAYRQLAVLLRGRFDDPEGADAVMEEMVKKNQRSPESLAARAGYWFNLPRLETERLKRMERLEPSEADGLRSQWLKAAQEDAADALELMPPDKIESLLRDPDLRWISTALLIAAKSSTNWGIPKRRELTPGEELRPHRNWQRRITASWLRSNCNPPNRRKPSM